jgi:hypothetical protein
MVLWLGACTRGFLLTELPGPCTLASLHFRSLSHAGVTEHFLFEILLTPACILIRASRSADCKLWTHSIPSSVCFYHFLSCFAVRVLMEQKTPYSNPGFVLRIWSDSTAVSRVSCFGDFLPACAPMLLLASENVVSTNCSSKSTRLHARSEGSSPEQKASVPKKPKNSP